MRSRSGTRAAFSSMGLHFGILFLLAFSQSRVTHEKASDLKSTILLELQPSSQVNKVLTQQVADSAKPAATAEVQKDSSNQTQPELLAQVNGPSGPQKKDHGVIVLYSPAPLIPDHLKSEDFKQSVLIEFSISAENKVATRLLSSSGNQELDWVALNKVQEWKFEAAEIGQRSVDSKLKVKIVFEVL